MFLLCCTTLLGPVNTNKLSYQHFYWFKAHNRLSVIFAEYFESRSLPGKTPGLQSDPLLTCLVRLTLRLPCSLTCHPWHIAKTYINVYKHIYTYIMTRCQLMTLSLLRAPKSQIKNGKACRRAWSIVLIIEATFSLPTQTSSQFPSSQSAFDESLATYWVFSQ